jgi:hypothetical protein
LGVIRSVAKATVGAKAKAKAKMAVRKSIVPPGVSFPRSLAQYGNVPGKISGLLGGSVRDAHSSYVFASS